MGRLFTLVVSLLASVAVADDAGLPGPTTETVRVTFDYSRTQQQLALAGGYWSISPRLPLSGRFRDLGSVEQEVTLLGFRQPMLDDQALAVMNRLGLRPLTLTELLSLGAQQPSLSNVVALGARFDDGGKPNVAYLGSDPGSSSRYLLHQPAGEMWGSRQRFAAVPKRSRGEPAERPWLLPHFEPSAGIMLPGYYRQGITDGDRRPGESAQGFALIGSHATLMRWGRLDFLGIGWALAFRNTGEDRSGNVPTDPEILLTTPILFRVKSPAPSLTGENRASWHLFAAPGLNLMRDGRKGVVHFGVAATIDLRE